MGCLRKQGLRHFRAPITRRIYQIHSGEERMDFSITKPGYGVGQAPELSQIKECSNRANNYRGRHNHAPIAVPEATRVRHHQGLTDQSLPS